MKLHRSAAVIVFAALCVTLGAGCGKSSEQTPVTSATGSQSVVRGIVAGDTVVLQEGSGVVGGKLVAGPLTRRVTVKAFTVGKTSDADWELMDASGKKLDAGSWKFGSLNTAHPFYLPGVFDSKTRAVGDGSLLWLAQQEYRELKATSGTTINPRFTDIPEWQTRVKANAGAEKALAGLRALQMEAEKAKKDTTYARVESGTTEATILVNGKETKVPVIRVKNWFGTYDILDREDNSIILNFTLSPDVDKKRLDVTTGDGMELSKLVNYQVKEIVFLGN